MLSKVRLRQKKWFSFKIKRVNFYNKKLQELGSEYYSVEEISFQKN